MIDGWMSHERIQRPTQVGTRQVEIEAPGSISIVHDDDGLTGGGGGVR
jgi:hypothetical protein